MADEVSLAQRVQGIAPSGIVRLIAFEQQLDFIAKFHRVEVVGSDTFLFFEPNNSRDFGIRVSGKEPKDVENGVIFYGPDDNWRITAASAEEVAAFKEAWKVP